MTARTPRIAIIGGGAAGLFAAICAARLAVSRGLAVETVIYEALPRVGKKLLATGNGRCNLTNQTVRAEDYYGDPALLRRVLPAFTNEDAVAFFRSLGLYTKADPAGRVYPVSNQASSVLDALRFACSAAGVRMLTDRRVASVKKMSSGFLIDGTDRADAVIYACGSSASNGEVGASVSVLHNLGVRTVPFAPALCPLKLLRYPAYLKGVRANGEVRLLEGSRTVASDQGEIQYADYGVSGIPVMQVTAAAAGLFREGKRLRVAIDSAPDIPREEIMAFLKKQRAVSPDLPAGVLLGGLLPKKLGEAFLKACGLRAEQPSGGLTDRDFAGLVSQIKEKCYEVERPLGMAHAQVAAGGVPAEELVSGSLALKRAPRFYVCGEALDVHGPCGGYNLQWAWSSAHFAAACAVEDITCDQNQ